MSLCRIHGRILISLIVLFLWPLNLYAGYLESFNSSDSSSAMTLKLKFSEAVPEFKVFNVEQPARIALDFSNTSTKMPKFNKVNLSNAENITVLEMRGKTRFIVSLKKSTKYVTRKEGNYLVLTLGDNVKDNKLNPYSSRDVASDSVQSPVQESNLHPMNQTANQPQVVSANVNPQLAPQKNMEPRYNQTAVSHSQNGGGNYNKTQVSPIVQPQRPNLYKPSMNGMITAVEFFKGSAAGSGDVVITLERASMMSDIVKNERTLDITFLDGMISPAVLKYLDLNAQNTAVKFLKSTNVGGQGKIRLGVEPGYKYQSAQQGNQITITITGSNSSVIDANAKKYTGEKISLNFQEIDVRSVLQLIAEFNDLNLVAGDEVQGNVSLRLQNVPWDQALDIVLTSSGMGKRLKHNVLTVAPAEVLAERERKELEAINKLAKLAPLKSKVIQINYATAEEVSGMLLGNDGAGTISERGSVQVVERTNSLMIQETEKNLRIIEALIAKIDIPVKQVQIEARIVTVDSSYTSDFGVKWSFEDSHVDLSSGISNIIFGFVSDSGELDLELSALEADGGGEVVSQPRVVTANKQKAVIKSGSEIPYSESSASGAASVAYKEAVLSLEVVPQITPDGRVLMKLEITNNDVGEINPVSGEVSINKNEVKTQVLVTDGETVVLGGIYRNSNSEGVSKVPFLGDIPLIGGLFRQTTRSDIKKEVLMFITPTIIDDSLVLN